MFVVMKILRNNRLTTLVARVTDAKKVVGQIYAKIGQIPAVF